MWTTHLYYKKYTHMVQIATADSSRDSDPDKWCKENLPRSYKKRDHGYSRTHTITRFYCNKSGYNQLMAEFGSRVVEHSKPFNSIAEQQLLQGLTLELRDHLYYNKYRYSIHLSIRDDHFDFKEWCASNLGVFKTNYYHTHGNVAPLLYLNSDNELLHVKLSLSEHICSAKCAWLEDEVVNAIR